MASVPAEATAGNVPATTGGDTTSNANDDIIENKSDLILGFNRLTLLRQLVLMIGVAASIAMGIAIILWANEPEYQPIFSDMSAYDINEVSTLLDTNAIPYRIEPRTGALLVESESVGRARLQLAAAGISGDRTVGFELLDQETGMGTSQFMESARYRRALEGELARTISSMRSVKAARIHLAIPKQSVFIRETRRPTASVFLDLSGGRRIQDEQVEAIVNLVAGSVPEMLAKDVSVVDQRGNLLSMNNMSETDRRTSREFQYARRVEDILNQRLNSLLEPVVGMGNFRSQVSADVDFTSVEKAEETFNPELQAIRSEQELAEQRVEGAVAGIPGALSNQPPTPAIAPEEVDADGDGVVDIPETTDIRRQAVRNYEVDRTISYIKRQQGTIQRLTVAVALNDIRRVNPEGEVTLTPWPQQELDRLTILIKDAVGFSAARGDSVSVINTPFMAEEVDFGDVEVAIWEQPWIRDVIKWGMAFLIVLILVFGVIRPTFKNLSTSGADAKNLALAGDDEGLVELDNLSENPPEQGKVGLSSAGDFLLPGASDSYERQVNALKGLVAEDPGRVAQVVRQWVMADE